MLIEALYSNNTNQENVSSIRLQSFNNDGFTTGSSGNTNTSGRTFCAWTWRTGGSSGTFNVDGEGYATTAAAGITAVSIALDGASVGRESGFSIVTFTGDSTTTGTIGTV